MISLLHNEPAKVRLIKPEDTDPPKPGDMRQRANRDTIALGYAPRTEVYTHAGEWKPVSSMAEACRLVDESRAGDKVTIGLVTCGHCKQMTRPGVFHTCGAEALTPWGVRNATPAEEAAFNSRCPACGVSEGRRHDIGCPAGPKLSALELARDEAQMLRNRDLVEVPSPAVMHMLPPGCSMKNIGDMPMVFVQQEGDAAKVRHDDLRSGDPIKLRDDALENAQRVVQTLMTQNEILDRLNKGLTEHIDRLLNGVKPRELPAGVKPAINLGRTHD